MRWIGFVFICLLAEPGAASCVKEVFNRYCLGGSLESLLAANSPLAEETHAEYNQYRFADEGKTIWVSARQDQIVSVARHEPPGTWINFQDWKRKLVALYGRGEDLSEFPPSAASRSARLNAVRTGKGRGHIEWRQENWRVAVIWESPDYVSLEYRLGGNHTKNIDEEL